MKPIHMIACSFFRCGVSGGKYTTEPGKVTCKSCLRCIESDKKLGEHYASSEPRTQEGKE